MSPIQSDLQLTLQPSSLPSTVYTSALLNLFQFFRNTCSCLLSLLTISPGCTTGSIQCRVQGNCLKKKNSQFDVFSSISSVHTPTMTNFKLSMVPQPACKVPEFLTNNSHELVHACIHPFHHLLAA